jgi:hypothetical protein
MGGHGAQPSTDSSQIALSAASNLCEGKINQSVHLSVRLALKFFRLLAALAFKTIIPISRMLQSDQPNRRTAAVSDYRAR